MQIPVHLAIAWTGGYMLGEVLGHGLSGQSDLRRSFPPARGFICILQSDTSNICRAAICRGS